MKHVHCCLVRHTCLKTMDDSIGSSGGSMGTGTEGMGSSYERPDLISTSAGTLDGSSCHVHTDNVPVKQCRADIGEHEDLSIASQERHNQ